MRNNKKLLL